MSELIVTGCIVAPCRNEPEWLVPAVMQPLGGAIQLDAMLQVCTQHLWAFGYDPTHVDDVGYPTRLTYSGYAVVSSTGRTPHHMRKREVAG